MWPSWMRVVALTMIGVGCTQARATVVAVEALVSIPEGREAAWLHEAEATKILEAASAATLLKQLRAARRGVSGLAPVAKVMLQNDVWGLAQRLEQSPMDSPDRRSLLTAARALVHALAPDPDELSALEKDPTPLPFLTGYQEFDSEHVSLMHERAFGYRRMFRLFLRGDTDRALVSQMVVLDRAGRPHVTGVVGEVEMLTFSAAGAGSPSSQSVLTAARVFKRSRSKLTQPNGPPLVEQRTVAHVPDIGANVFLARFDWPERALDGLPCQSCHDTAMMMSLPTAKTRPADRHRRLLDELMAGRLQRVPDGLVRP